MLHKLVIHKQYRGSICLRQCSTDPLLKMAQTIQSKQNAKQSNILKHIYSTYIACINQYTMHKLNNDRSPILIK